MILPMVVASIFTGVVTSRVGYYTPPMLIGSCIMPIGVGLLTTLQVDSGKGEWIGYQILYGWGLGMTFQAPNLAAQTVLPRDDVPVGTSLMFFGQLLGGSIFISVGQNVLNNQLIERLSRFPGFTPALLTNAGATALIQALPAEARPQVLLEYNEALRKVFQVALIVVCLTIFGSLALEWRSVKKNVPKKDKGSEGNAEEGQQQEAQTEKTISDDEEGDKAKEKSKEKEAGEGVTQS